MSDTPQPLRIFLGAFGQPGHVFPMLALGQSLRARGHSVWFETWERWRTEIEAAGMRFVPAPERPVFPTPDHPMNPYEAAAEATPSTRAALASVRPDVVVHDVLTLAPALAAELAQIPAVTLIPHVYPVSAPGFPPYGLGVRPALSRTGRAAWNVLSHLTDHGLRVGREQLNAARARVGLPVVERLYGGISDQLCLVATLPALEYPRHWPSHVHVVGPLMWEPSVAASRLPSGDEPLVLVAPSTAQDPDQRLLRVALAGLADAPVRVVAVTNHRAATHPMRAGPGAVLAQWLSYAQVMPRCAAVIAHAGHGTLVRALASGAPVLAVPHSGDMGENAARLAWSGAGVRLPWRRLSPRRVRQGINELLADGSGYAARASEIATWTAAHDGPTVAAELIERLMR